MEPFEYCGKRLETWTVAGTVISTSKHSITDVSSSGGGGWIGPDGGTVHAPTVTSLTTTEQEIWIRRDGGEETVVKLFDVQVPVREGQKVTVIGARRPDGKDGFWLNFVNHSANRHWRLNTNSAASGRGRLGAEPLLRWYDWVIAIMLGRLVAVPHVTQLLRHLTPSSALELTIGLPVLYLVTRRLWRAHRRNRIFAALDAWVERGAQTTYSAERRRAGGTVRSEVIA